MEYHKNIACAEFEHLIREFPDMTRLHLNNREPTKVKPLEIHLKPSSVAVRALQRKYSPEKRNFLEKYVHNLFSLGLVVPTEDPK